MQVRVICAMMMAATRAVPAAHAQGTAEALRNAYRICITEIKNAPQDAYDPCKQYVAKFPHDDTRRINWVKTWISKYEKAAPYVQFLEGLRTDKNAPWFVYAPDTAIPLPQTSDAEGPYKIEISRSFGSSEEEVMLREAEAVYPNPETMIADVCKSLVGWDTNHPAEMAPLWGLPGNDQLQEDEIVTARAVRYYYDLSLAEKTDHHLTTRFDAVTSALKYVGEIKHYDHYAHKKDIFENVYVADLTLEWSFVCGGLCGMGFTRNKVVVLDSKGNILAMYSDSPVNSTSWVS